MSNNYDNWGRLVEAVLKREQFRQLALAHSRESSISSVSSSFSFRFESLHLEASSSKVNETDGDRLLPSDYSNGGVLSATRSSAGLSLFSAAASDDTCVSGEILPTPNLKNYTFADLKKATKNFKSDMVLGEVAFGTVFKGLVDSKTLSPSKVRTGMLVAIKKLNHESLQGYEEWQSEVNFLGRLSHPNLINVFGYCWEDKELSLVYEFMQKGSLEHHLFRRSGIEPLSWDIRLKIAIGAARGLAFLHTLDKPYRNFMPSNIKPSNILLDGSCNAKLSDFGFPKLVPSEGNSHATTRVMGTYGYAALEYVATGHLYLKSNVYGFGVVLLEMLTGLPVLDYNRPIGQQNLVVYAKPFLSQKRKLMSIMDARMDGQYSSKAALQASQLTLRCLESEPIKRPSMKEVVAALEQIAGIGIPKESNSKSVHSSSHHHHHHHGYSSVVCGFGVVSLEMLTGLCALDTNRPSGQQNLVDYAKPFLSRKRKLMSIMNARMEVQYSSNAALKTAQLSLRALN
ncbi:Protein kinase superfamily protein [Forsythia ovata]|uniref:non-specific serine/threonine protein kinase n=1 Tax=Forsythia ovata TaxID=205694 RepID=A0ABD1WNU3_9LAMI